MFWLQFEIKTSSSLCCERWDCHGVFKLLSITEIKFLLAYWHSWRVSPNQTCQNLLQSSSGCAFISFLLADINPSSCRTSCCFSTSLNQCGFVWGALCSFGFVFENAAFWTHGSSWQMTRFNAMFFIWALLNSTRRLFLHDLTPLHFSSFSQQRKWMLAFCHRDSSVRCHTLWWKHGEDGNGVTFPPQIQNGWELSASSEFPAVPL